MELLEFLGAEWDLIRQAPATLLTGAVLLFSAGYVVARWYFKGQIETLRDRISLRDEQAAEYKRKLADVSSDEATAMIKALNSRLDALSPRTLTDDQKLIIARAASRKEGFVWIAYDVTAQDGASYASQFVEVFRRAAWQVDFAQIVDSVSIEGITPEGLVVREQSKALANRYIIDALEEAKVDFAIAPSGPLKGAVPEPFINIMVFPKNQEK